MNISAKGVVFCLITVSAVYSVQLENWRLPYFIRAAEFGYTGASPSGMFWDEVVPEGVGNTLLWPDSARYGANHWTIEPAFTTEVQNTDDFYGKDNFSHLSLLNDIKYNHFLVRQVLDVDTRYADDPAYPWNKQRFAAGRIAEAYLQYDWSHGFFRLGRLNRNWGPFPDHSLILSSNPYSYDAAELKIASSFFEFRDLFAAFPYATSNIDSKSYLDPNGKLNARYLSIHSLNLILGRWGAAGITEAVLFSQNNGIPDLQFVNPISSYTVVRTNGESDANLMLGFQWNLHPYIQNVSLKGQLLIDDIQVDNKGPGDQKPNHWGLDCGASITHFLPLSIPHALMLEYVFLSRWVYTICDDNTEKGQRYTYLDQSLGYPINDGDQASAVFTLMANNFWVTDIGLSYARKGQGKLTTPWKDLSDSSKALGIVYDALGYRTEPSIPSGIVERTIDPHIDLLLYFKNYIDARFELHNRWIKNKDNVTTMSYNYDPLISATLSVHFSDFFCNFTGLLRGKHMANQS